MDRPRMRRALSAPGGAVRTDGDRALARRLAEALVAGTGELSPDERALPHGFHSYPARFHPRLVRALIDGTARGATLLDPFCGSGTTLVEGALHGARSLGVDVNPLAVELARLKATPCPAPLRAGIVSEAQRLRDASLARVKERARTRTSGNEYDSPKHYAPHVFRELVGLREELDGADELVRRQLLLVLSSIVVKVSRQASDTAEGQVERAIGKGMASRLFARRAEELARQLTAFAERVPPGTPEADVRLGDARRLGHVKTASVDLVITSPPYLGTYDYAAQHARRFGWLGLDARKMDALEIGARRRAKPEDALTVWQKDVDAFVAEFARVLRPGGSIYVVIGDSAVGTRSIAGDAAIRAAAEKSRLRVIASAAQDRPNFYAPTGRALRREHLLLLR
jgi:SAM-dependent methyltransferase